MQPPTDLLRQAAERRLVRAEQRIEPVVDAAVDAWVWALHDTLIRVAVRQHRSTAVTAAGNSRRRQRRRAARTMAHGRPLTPPTTPEQHTTVDAAVSAYNRWRHDLDNTILPTISITFGEAFQDLRRRTPGSDFRPQQEYMATVADRLRIWPDGAFDELRPELEEALSEAETIEQITDRVGRVLGIDAQTRALKAEINEVDAKLNDPQLHPWRRDALTARRRALWAAHDDAMQEWRWKARRIARTESHGAVQAGQLAAALQAQEETGETWYKRWLCVTGDTRIRADGITHVARRRHEGPVVCIRTASGSTLTSTPEHRVLTRRGWVRIDHVDVGDDLFQVGVGDSSGAPDVEAGPPSIAETFDALVASKPIEVRSVFGGVDLDGQPVYREVEVVSSDSDLLTDIVPGVPKRDGNFGLPSADFLAESILLGCSGGDDGRIRLSSTAQFGAGLHSSGMSVLGGLACRSDDACGTVASPLDTSIFEDADDRRVRDIERVRQRSGRLAGNVPGDHIRSDSVALGPAVRHVCGLGCGSVGRESVRVGEAPSDPQLLDMPRDRLLRNPKVPPDRGGRHLGVNVHADQIVSIEVVAFSGHVYDLTTSSGWFEANGLVIHNCTEDVRTRVTHRVADGQMVPLTGQFRVGGFLLNHPGDPLVIAPHETINCFVSETPITAPGLQASIRAPYVGPLVTITMKSGGVLSGSPNHPILTERGWVRLGEIQQGDNLIRAQVSELDRRSRVDPHEQGAPTTIGEVHRALNQPTAVGRHRVARSVVDFYGDRPSGEVEVVPADRELRDRLDSAHAQHLSELGFQWRGPMLQPLPAPRAGFQLGFRTLDTTNRVVSGRGQSQPLILAGVRHAGEHGVAAVSGCDAGADQLSSNDGPADRVGQSERLLRLAGQVAANDALGVEHYASLLQRLADRYTQLSQSFTEGGLLDAVESGDVVEGDSLGELCHNGIHIDRDSSTAVLRHSPDRHTTVDEGLTDGAGTCPEVCGDSVHGLPISVPARNLGIIKREPLGASDVGWGAEPNTSTDEPITNGLPGYPELLTDIGGALAGLVEHDEVVGIDVCAFRGHLYTVQTESGIYAASSYIVRNCRCSCTFLDPDAAQEALQGPDGSLGEIRPGGVRLGTDDPTAAAEAIREVAETEQRALPPDPDARGEDAGQPSPAPTPPVDAPDEQPIAPQVTDMSGLTDSDLLELMQDANRVGDDELYDAAVAEWDARSALDHSREDDTETPSSLSEPAGGPVETDAQFAGLDDAELIAVMNDAINADDDDLYRAAAAAEWARREGLTSAGRVRDEAFWSRRWRRPAAYGEPIRGGRSQIPQRGGDHPQRTTNRFMPSGTDLPDEYQDLPGGSPIPFTPRTAPMPTPEDMERVLDKHRHDSTAPNKSRFPESWSDQDVAGAIAITIQLPDRPVQRFGTSLVFERDVDGILVRAQVRTDSDPSIFWSAYPPKVVD